jgi:hypothetical protein
MHRSKMGTCPLCGNPHAHASGPSLRTSTDDLAERLLLQSTSDYGTWCADLALYGSSCWEDIGGRLVRIPPNEVVVRNDGTYERVTAHRGRKDEPKKYERLRRLLSRLRFQRPLR